LLATAAVECVKEWEFEPARKNGVAVPFDSTVEINFTLKKD
jgi:outer membrane biosynthesis protein TonB